MTSRVDFCVIPFAPNHLPAGCDERPGTLSEQGIQLKYDRIHRVLGEGNFVLVVSEGSFGGRHSSFYDLFRIDQGKVAEHWDVIETIPPREQWKNQNGKF